MHVDIGFALAPTVLSLCGIGIATYYFLESSPKAEKQAANLGSIYRFVYRKFYIDEIYLFFTKKVLFNLIGKPAAWIDRNIVDGMMNGFAYLTATKT